MDKSVNKLELRKVRKEEELVMLNLPQGISSGARASTMHGRVGVIFQGRGFESHSRGIFQFYFLVKSGKVFPVTNMKPGV